MELRNQQTLSVCVCVYSQHWHSVTQFKDIIHSKYHEHCPSLHSSKPYYMPTVASNPHRASCPCPSPNPTAQGTSRVPWRCCGGSENSFTSLPLVSQGPQGLLVAILNVLTPTSCFIPGTRLKLGNTGKAVVSVLASEKASPKGHSWKREHPDTR